MALPGSHFALRELLGKNISMPCSDYNRVELGVSVHILAFSMARSVPRMKGWDLDIMVLNRIELGKRTLTDFEIQKILDVLGRKWADLDE